MHCHHSYYPAALHGRSLPPPNHNPFFVTINPSVHKPLSSPLTHRHNTRAISTEDDQEEAPPLEISHFFRRQNARSTSCLLYSGLQAEPKQSLSPHEVEELQRNRVAEEMSLATRRAPRFPGSIEFPSAEWPGLSLELAGVLDTDDRVLKRALKVRRGVAAETLKEALRAGKLSVTYSANLVSTLGGFVDRVVIQAAAMKEDPEVSHTSFNARAKSYIQRSGIVPLVKWLKHNSLTYPQIGKVVGMCSGDLKRIRHVAEWLKSIHVKGEFLGVVLVKGRSILERDLDSLEEFVSYLEKNGIMRDWVGFVVSRCPQVLTLTMEELEARVRFYLDMGMSEKNFGTMIFDYPRALGFFTLEEMNNKVAYLKEFGLSTEDVGRLLAFKPQLMGCSIEERWKPLVKYLYYLGVRRDGMKRILIVKPMVFCVDLETTIAPKVRFLQDIGVRQEAIGGALVKFPALLTYSLYKKIRPVVIFLMTKAGVTQKDIGKVIALDPQLVGCSIIGKLEVNVKYFLSLGIRLQSLGEMIADFPMLLRYNLDILRPKYRYLRRIMVRPLPDLIEFPRFFSYSLDDRIVPRHKILVENRINFKLRYMLAGPDEDFNQRVQAAIEKRERFESGETGCDLSDSETPHVGAT